MEQLLRELETQLAAMSERQRAAVGEALRGMVTGFRVLTSEVDLSARALLSAIGQVQVWRASNVAGSVVLDRVRAKAKGVGRYVAAIVATL